MDEIVCSRCDYIWEPRAPVSCPECKSYRWREPAPEIGMAERVCRKCGFKWFTRSDRVPAVCAACKSYAWEKPGRRKLSREKLYSIRVGLCKECRKPMLGKLKCGSCGYEYSKFTED